MFNWIMQIIKNEILPDITEMVSRNYARLEEIINKESKKIVDIQTELEHLKTFVIEQQQDIDDIKKIKKKGGKNVGHR